MRTKYLCLYYGIAVSVITIGLYSYTNYISVNTLWDDGMCPESIEAHKHMGENLSISNCYDAQHGVRSATIALIICLDSLSTLFFIIGIDMNRKEISTKC